MAPVDPVEYWLIRCPSERQRKSKQSILARFAAFAKTDPAQLLNDGFKRRYESREPPLELENLLIQFYQHLCHDEQRHLRLCVCDYVEPVKIENLRA